MKNYKNAADRARISREMAREGIILLKNEAHILPLGSEPVAVFGRTQVDLIKCGTGSAYCESEYCVDVLTGLENAGAAVDRELAARYRAWSAENQVASFGVWGSGSHSNPEMPLEEDVVAAAARRNEKALFVIGRTAGENDDVNVMVGDYLLSVEEQNALDLVCRYFDRVIVVLNSGNLMDMNFTCRREIQGVVLLNLPGMEGGNALADVLTGVCSPSGKLTDTIAYAYQDYPSSRRFGKKGGIIQKYEDDIFVGYRYFETFPEARERVMYPFGFGLSYTEFSHTCRRFSCENGTIRAEIAVKNTGAAYAGKDVVMLYASAPASKLGTPACELKTFEKTGLLQPGEEEVLTLSFPVKDLASFDDTGVLGTRDAWMLLQGDYTIAMGNNVCTRTPIGICSIAENTVVKTCTHLPTQLKKRMTADGTTEPLDYVPSDPARGFQIDPVEETVVPPSQAEIVEDKLGYRLHVSAAGVYRVRCIGDRSAIAEVTLNRIRVDDLDALFSKEGMDLILMMKTNGLAFTGVDGIPAPVELRLLKNNDPIVIRSEGPSYVEGGKFCECGLWSNNRPFLDADGPMPKGRALSRMHSPGRNAMYRLEVEQAGLYDVRMRYISRHPDRDLRDTFSFLISNVGQEVEPVQIRQTTTEKDHRPMRQPFATTEPFVLALPKGECYLKIVSAAYETPNIAWFELTPTQRPLYQPEKASGGARRGNMDGKDMTRPTLPPQTQKYDLRSVLRGELTVDELLDNLTDEELVQLTCGNKLQDERIGALMERGIPGAFWSDGPVGLRQEMKVTVYPSSTMIATSWNKALAEEYGYAIGTEARQMNVDVWLAPAMNIHRSPCCGRNFEYYSEDPVVSGVMAAQVVRGVQKMHVAATAKHFAANNTEYQRLSSNSRVSARAMFEIYMRGFELMIREEAPMSIMTSYNYINGIKSSERRDLCTGVIRNDFGYRGVLMSDFGNDSSHIRELAAGHDLKMPFGDIPGVVKAMADGTLTRAEVTVCAKRVLEMVMNTVVKNTDM